MALLLASLAVAVQAEGVPEIDVSAAAKLIQDKKVFVLDVREPSEYAAGHIDGSVLVPLAQVDARFEEIAKHKGKPMLVVCGSGGRSARAIEILSKRGFSQMRNITGGMNAWRKADLPVTKN
jgi:rhodanese-related sulfurtransferase